MNASKKQFSSRIFEILFLMIINFALYGQNPNSRVVPLNEPYCILQIPAPFMGTPNCYQFFVCSARTGTLCTAANLGSGTWGACSVTPLATRSGFVVDPNAHPPGAATPFLNFEAADGFMQALSPWGGDWYGCFSQPNIFNLPSRTPPVSDNSDELGYCILRKPELYQPNQENPPICFEFFKAHTDPTENSRYRRASIVTGTCFVTDLAGREGWEVDPSFGGPYIGSDAWMEAELAMKRLSKYADDFYGCLTYNEDDDLGNFGGGALDIGGIRKIILQENEVKLDGSAGNKWVGTLTRIGVENKFEGSWTGTNLTSPHVEEDLAITEFIPQSKIVIKRSLGSYTLRYINGQWKGDATWYHNDQWYCTAVIHTQD
jgi:hypothetical protein